MKDEINIQNGCKIFCIFIKHINDSSNEGEDTLKKIAKLGQTENIYTPSDLSSLCEAFFKIADIIETNYKLRLNKIINN
jgi:hypothetical protein